MADFSAIDEDAMRAAVAAHKVGQTKFTRRMAINIGDHFGLTPMGVVWYCEKKGILKSGSWSWFKQNGGITKDHLEEARQDRSLPLPSGDATL